MSEFLKYFDSLAKKPNNYKQLLKESNENMNTLKNEVRLYKIYRISLIITILSPSVL